MIYNAVGHNQAPIGMITSGLSGPEGMAVDRLGRLFVTNTSNNTVTVYRRGGTTPVRTYSSGLNGPAGVVIGNDKTVYVSNLYGNNVDAYAGGSLTPTTIYTGVNFPIAVTLDASNNLYVTNGSGITKFPSGSTHGTNLGIVLQNPSGIAIDLHRNIVVANQMPPSIYVYPPGKTQPKLVFGKEGDPNPIAFLGSEKQLFAGEPLSNTVNVYAYPSGTKVNAITNGVVFPAGVAVDPAAPF
jgi:serine/threonine-protein kinase